MKVTRIIVTSVLATLAALTFAGCSNTTDTGATPTIGRGSIHTIHTTTTAATNAVVEMHRATDYLRQLYIDGIIPRGETWLTSATNGRTQTAYIVTTYIDGGQYSSEQLNTIRDMTTAGQLISTDIQSRAANATVTTHWNQFKTAYEKFLQLP